jgi:pyruvate-formate lyase
MKSQKQAVVDEVVSILGSKFTPFKDNALSMLSASELELVKKKIASDIMNCSVTYGKDPSKSSEVTAYARSMVMNHLKKARELNGGSSSVSHVNTSSKTPSKNMNKRFPKGLNPHILSEEMQNFASSLVS